MRYLWGVVRMQCEFTKENGETCAAQAVLNDEHCFAHSQLPKIIEKRTQAKILGGKNGRKINFPVITEKMYAQTNGEIVTLLEQTINDVRMNKISTNQANAIAFLCNTMGKFIEAREESVRRSRSSLRIWPNE